MMERFIIWKRFSLVRVLLLAGLLGCVHDKLDGPDQLGKVIDIELVIPGFEVPLTRSIEGDNGEAAVRELDLLFFDQSTPSAKLFRHLNVIDFRQESSGADYKVKFSLNLTKDDQVGLIVVVVNAAGAVRHALESNPADAEKQDILKALTFNTFKDENDSYKWNVRVPGYTPLPMYGEVVMEGLVPGYIVSVSLTWMLARVDVENKVSGEIFKLEEIYLVNYNTSGYIAPKWNETDGVLVPNPYATNENPMIPVPSGKQPGVEEAAMKYEYKQAINAPGALMAGEIYTYEAVKNVKDDPGNGVCLIIKGKYMGEDYYYRVDFTLESELPIDIAYMPLYRNHKYVVTVTDAEGIGYRTFEEALRSFGVLSNLKTSILVVNLEGINHIVYDGQFFMGVESRTLDLPYGVSRQLTYRVSSDYHGAWEAKVLHSETNTWLRLAGGQSVTKGADINGSGLELVISSVFSPGSGRDYVTGQIEFTAGRLRDTLTVRRVPIAEMFARSNVVLNAGVLTFAVTAEDNRDIPAWSQGVFFKWGSLIALASAGNPYDPEVQAVYYPPHLNPSDWKGGLIGWDKIPYAHSNFNFSMPSGTGEDVDAFAGYSGNTGFNENVGVGDICRYISSWPGGKGWVEGEWRLPTNAELELLYEETGIKTVSMGGFVNMTAELNRDAGNYLHGNFDPESGWFLGANVTGSMATPANRTTPPSGTVFLPSAGQRYPDGNGDVVHVGAYGYYWASTPYSVNGGYIADYLFIYKSGVDFNAADRSYAFPVRCIKDY